MLTVSKLKKSFGSQTLFEDVAFSIQPGERVGLIGRNGHGKSTLFRILSGQEEVDGGEIVIPDGYHIGLLDQHLAFTEKNILDEVAKGLTKDERQWGLTHRAEAILHGLGFSDEDFKRPPSEFSGGFQVRLSLARLLLTEPNLLLLDEPTNYLDIVSTRWLLKFLQNWPRELLLITHDRHFMDAVSTHTMGIHRAQIKKISGPTDKYWEQIALEEEIHEKTRANQEKKRADVEQFISRFRAKASKAKAVQSRVKMLEKQEELDSLAEVKSLDFEFTAADFPGKWLMNIHRASFSYPGSDLRLFENLSFSVGKTDRIAVIGKNGIGKSTLLSVLADVHKPTEGEIERNNNLELAYFGQTNVDRLSSSATVEQEIGSVAPEAHRTKIRTICGLMMFEGDAALKPISVLSGGERARVLLGKLLLTPANLLLLDEPSHHLDQFAADALLDAVEAFPGAIVMVTHSETVLREIANRLIVFDGGEVTLFEGGYDDFLNRIGWAEERTGTSSNKKGPKVNKKELRKERAALLAEKSARSKSLKKRVTELESEIAEKESEVETAKETLVEITKDGFGSDAADLSITIGILNSKIEELYEELLPLSDDLQEVEQEFEERLSRLQQD